jgi:hypothetical protein
MDRHRSRRSISAIAVAIAAIVVWSAVGLDDDCLGILPERCCFAG